MSNNLADRSVLGQQKLHKTDGVTGESTFKFAVNSSGCNKGWNYEELATGYRDEQGTLADVIEHVMQGHAIAAGCFGGKRRCKANVTGTHWILGDIDNSKLVDGQKVYDPQLTIEQALDHPFIKKYCALIYTSASHTADWHRFRLVFMLPDFVEGWEEIEQIVRFMMAEFPFLDPSCKDASRVFYGNTEADFPLYNPEAVLPVEWVQEAKEQAKLDRIAYQAQCEEIQRRKERYPQCSQDTDALVMQALTHIPPRSPGSGNYEECTKVAMALVSHFGEMEAERIIEGWSPSIPGNTWNVAKKVRSYKRGGVSIGTLFHIAKSYGFKFPVKNDYLDGLTNTGGSKVKNTKDGHVIYSEDEKLRLALLDLSQEQNKIAFVRKRAQLCSHYRISKSEVEELLKDTIRKTSTSGLQRTSFDQLLEMEIEELSWLIPELLPSGEMVILGGSPKSGKTLMAIDAAFAIATGESDFLGQRTRKGKVLLISNDENPRSTKNKLLKRGFRTGDGQNLDIIFNWDISQLYELEQVLDSFRPDVVVIDSLKSVTAKNADISENSAEFANNIYTLKTLLNQYNAASILIHHTNKSKDAMGVAKLRGSTAIAGAVWGTWQLEHIPKPDPNNNGKMIVDPSDPARTLSVHARDIEGQLLSIEFDPEYNSYTRTDKEAIQEHQTLSDRIAAVLRINKHGLTARGILEVLNIDPGTSEARSIYNALNRMESKLAISARYAKSNRGNRGAIYTVRDLSSVDENLSSICHQGGDSLSPPPRVFVDDKSSTSLMEKEFKSCHQLPKICHQPFDTHHTDDQPEALTDGSPSQFVITDDKGGGEGVPQKLVTSYTELHNLPDPALSDDCADDWLDFGLEKTEGKGEPIPLDVDAFTPDMKVTFNRKLANKESRDRIPENVTTGEVVSVGFAAIKVQWDGLEVPQYHQPHDLEVAK